MTIKLGSHYEKSFLEKSTASHIINHRAIKKPYGYFITKITHYVAIYKTKLVINDDGSAKAVTKVDINYHPEFQYTTYFDTDGRKIKSSKYGCVGTSEELIYYNNARREKALKTIGD